MTVLRPYRLERELDSAFYHWLAWLPHWHPAGSRRRGICAQCPRYVDALGLDDIPHVPLHTLFGALELLLDQQSEREFAAQFPDLYAGIDWIVGVEHGRVHVLTTTGIPLDEVLAARSRGFALWEPAVVSVADAARARAELARMHMALFESAIGRLGAQRGVILQAIDAHVEPKVRSLADTLIQEICAA